MVWYWIWVTWVSDMDGHGLGWTPGVGDGQGGLACCSSWGRKESDTTEWLNWTPHYFLLAPLNTHASQLFTLKTIIDFPSVMKGRSPECPPKHFKSWSHSDLHIIKDIPESCKNRKKFSYPFRLVFRTYFSGLPALYLLVLLLVGLGEGSPRKWEYFWSSHTG